MKKLSIFLVGILWFCSMHGQSVSIYSFAESAGTYAALGGTNSTAVGDDGVQNGIPIGFNFSFGGTVYTHFCIGTNGFIKLGNAATTVTGAFGNYNNSLSNTATDRPEIGPFWEDNNRNTGAITYGVSGVAGSQVLTVDWNAINIGGIGATSATSLASFQLKLYETTNVIEFIYGTMDAAGTLTASVGLNDNTSFLSVTPAAASTVSSATANNGISSTTDLVGKKYTFTPPAGCSGAPTAGSISGPAGACSGVAFTLTNTGATVGAGMHYAWQSSSSLAGPFTNIPGQNSVPTASVSQTAVTYYRFVDTCTNSTLSAISSNTLQVNMNAPSACYCTPTYSSGCSGDNLASVVLGTLNDAGLSCTPIYEDRTPLQPGTLSIPGIAAGTTASLTLTFGTDGNQYNGVWVDFNQDGIFSTSEYFTSATNAGASGTAVVSIVVPVGATLGNTRMRIRGGDDSQPTSAQACGAATSNWGSARDYLVNILPAPSCLPVSGLSATSASTSSVTLGWTAVAGAAGYEYLVDGTPGDPAGTGTPTASTSGTVPGPYTLGSTYYGHVRTSCGGNLFSTWTNISFTIPPACTTNTTPANGATNVSISPNITLAWAAAPGATSYDVYFGTVNPPTTLLGNTTATTVGITGGSANTTYYWYISPRGASSAATGCSSNTTSFTTVTTCTPSTTNGGSGFGDAITDFVLNGESGTSISVTGAAGLPAPGYVDLSGSTTVDLAPGKAYSGNFKVQDGSDDLTIWIDLNNNGSFEASERILNNLVPAGGSTTTPYSIFIPASASLGVHKMRIRDVYYFGGTTVPTDQCANYGYGEGKDFSVNIVASGAAYTVSASGAGACATAAFTTIDAGSNNTSFNVPLLDASGALLATVNAGGNDLGKIVPALYINNSGTVRRVGTAGQFYLDRNISITPAIQPAAGNVAVRLYFTAADLLALHNADPTNVPSATSPASLNSTKVAGGCTAAFTGTGTLLSQTGSGSQGSDYYIDVSTPSFSNFFIHGGNIVLPVSIEFFTGSKQGSNNFLDWKVNCTSSPSVTIVLERSFDGQTFRGISTISANSIRCLQGFNYTDVAPPAGISYYRLKVTTPDGAFKYSNIVALINKDKGFELISVVPNPVKNTTVLSISSVKAGMMDITVMDALGRVVMKQSVNNIAGNTTVNLDFSSLGAGTYRISAVNSDGERKTTGFVKY